MSALLDEALKGEGDKLDSGKIKINNPQMHFLAHKAGMDSIDKEEIARKVYEASKDSEYYKRQQAKTERAREKGIKMKEKIENYKKNETLYRQMKNDAK